VPNLPGLAYAINSKSHVNSGIRHLYSFEWLYGFVVSIFLYVVLHKVFPWKESLVPRTIDGVDLAMERKNASPPVEGMEADDEKNVGRVSEHRRRSEGYGYANVDPIHHARDVYMEA
jgi:nucleobase:cation symporter-1, NCS1 family